MVVSSVSILSIRPCQNLNHHLLFHYHHRHRRRILSSLSLIPILNSTRWVHSNNSKNNRHSMATASSNNNNSGAFTTLKERVTFAQEIKKSKFIAIAGPLSDQRSANAFLSEVQDPKATHNCWAYKVGDQFRSNDDGEPSGTAGKPILSAIESSGIDRVMVVVIRHFGGIKLGTGGLVRAYGGVAAECLRNAPTCLVKSKVPMGLEVPYDLLGVVYHQLQSFKVEDIDQDYDTGKDGVIMVTFKVEFDQVESLEEAIKVSCSRDIVFYKR